MELSSYNWSMRVNWAIHLHGSSTICLSCKGLELKNAAQLNICHENSDSGDGLVSTEEETAAWRGSLSSRLHVQP